MIYEQSVGLLGKKVKDKITGSTGIVTSVCFDLYGCIQALITPGKIDKDGKEISSIGWVDINRLEVKKNKAIMKHPDFDRKYQLFKDVQGAADKPIPAHVV